MGGVKYYNSISIRTNGYGLYNLNGKYSSLSGQIGALDGHGSIKTVQFFCDGILRKEIEVQSGALPVDFTIDLTGVLQMKIAGYYGPTNLPTYAYAGIANPIIQ